MGPELDLEPKLEVSIKASSVSKENATTHQNRQESLLLCAANSREKTLDTEPSLVMPTAESDRAENEEIDITDVTHFDYAGAVRSDGAETVETSSSFGDTESVTDDGLEGDEVQSPLRGEKNLMSDFDGYCDMFRTRNKKLTTHWRKFIRPLMWRCKWMELRMKELQWQASKYDKELADYDERKRLEFGSSTSEVLDAKSLPFSSQSRRNKLMKRKKRKRVEETVNTESYMSQHNFFSYYVNKKFVPDGASVEVDVGNLGKTTDHNNEIETNEGFSLESRDEDSSFEVLFRNIEVVQSRVKQLISRVDMVVYVNSGKFSSINKLSNGITQNALGKSAQNATPSGSGNGFKVEPRCISSENTSGPNIGDLLMLDRPVSSPGEITPCSKFNRSTYPFQVEDILANNEEVLIDNELVKEELQDFEKFRDHFGEKSLVSEEQIENPPPVSEADSLPSKTNVRTKAKKRKRKTGLRR